MGFCIPMVTEGLVTCYMICLSSSIGIFSQTPYLQIGIKDELGSRQQVDFSLEQVPKQSGRHPPPDGAEAAVGRVEVGELTPQLLESDQKRRLCCAGKVNRSSTERMIFFHLAKNLQDFHVGSRLTVEHLARILGVFVDLRHVPGHKGQGANSQSEPLGDRDIDTRIQEQGMKD